ncbi:hypothetical protein NSP_34080 [Nodularia spumigena CCY9414]|nr:hypothetical protein NSP_34080 [Nodularia spumigena CCY9414]
MAVSVPLRGNGYEKPQVMRMQLKEFTQGFRPLAGKWL